MPKNIVIFSDGTGQIGGVAFDENRSNIYIMYRACRVGPDSTIDPAEQIAFYDAGLGATPPRGGIIRTVYRWLYNLVSQATGLGLTANMIDCYEFLIRWWAPGDRIFLFGFSRGAYTVRCLGGVLAFCGIPTKEPSGPLRRDHRAARKIASEGVKNVYQYTSSWSPNDAKGRHQQLLEQRAKRAAAFRSDYGSSGTDTLSNAYPYFIGAFDTVASLADKKMFALIAIASIALVAIVAGVPWALKLLPFWTAFGLLLGLVVVGDLIAYLATHLKWTRKTDVPVLQTVHLTELWQRFYDTELNKNVPFARHALSIDENRADFQRVPWRSVREQIAQGPIPWFEQMWFAGVHSDIGGSYPENESRLSDIALSWMVVDASRVPEGLRVDTNVLRTYPDAGGMQHDEIKRGYPRLTSWFKIDWKRAVRDIPNDAPLHPTVLERFELPAVLQYDVITPYRPEALR